MKTKTRPTIRTLAAAVACMAALTWASPAQAATLHRDGFDDVPADTVCIDYPLKIADATFATTNPSFRLSSIDDMWGWPADVVIYDAPVSSRQKLSGQFTLSWRDAGYDAAGDSIDITLTVSNIESGGRADDLILIDDGVELAMNATASAMKNEPPVRMQVSCAVVKSGTSTPAEGTLLVGFSDIDIVDTWPEQVELLSGFGPDVWVPPTNFLDISADATRFTGTRVDKDTYDSGFVTTGNPAGFTLRWQGTGCSTYMLQPFNVTNQSITAEAGEGGSISDPGKTVVRWKNDKSYTITPDAHWQIEDVLVDGSSVGPVREYTFREVTSNHTIRAEFSPIMHTVTFVDGFGETVSVQQVHEGTGAQAPDDPVHDGWAFTGWDDDFGEVMQDMTITALWDPLIAVRVPTLVSCRIMADGSVVAPSGYAIENLSAVAVQLESAVTQDMPSYASYDLVQPDGTVVHSYASGEDAAESALRIESDAQAELVWNVGDIAGEQAQELLLAALEGPTHLCDVTFTFKRAD